MSLGERERRTVRLYARERHRWGEVIFVLGADGPVGVKARPASCPAPPPDHVMVELEGETAPRLFYVHPATFDAMVKEANE